MVMDQTSLLEGERGHRRGVVLGLTMAEIMLMLLFCLLLVAASLMEERDKQIESLEAQVTSLGALPVAPQDAEPAPPAPSVDDLKFELEEARSTISEQAVELTVLRELESRAKEAFPQVNRKTAPETWRELVLAEEAGSQIIESGATLEEVEAAIEELKAQPNNVEVAALSPEGDNWPPMIQLGSGEFRFIRNSAQLSEDFRNRLQTEVTDRLTELLTMYDADVVEVVGHTDEQPIAASKPSTLDGFAIGAMSGNVPIENLVPADNAGLGLARAIAVANALNASLAVNGVKIIPLSAGQLVMPGDQVSDGLHPVDDPNRRRIEIRVRRSDSEGT